MRNEVDQHEAKIMQEAEYWTCVRYADGGCYKGECSSFLEAAKAIEGANRGLVYAVRHPNQALAATIVNGKWSLTKLRGLEHPLKNHIINGKLVEV